MNDISPISIPELIARQQPGHSLEQPFYRDPALFERDLERIVAKQWLFVDHVSKLAKAGDVLLYDIAGESIILVGGRDGVIRAFFNVCRHRGSRVCLKAEDNVRTLTCPYHGWVFDLEGKLVFAKNMPEGFDASAWPLNPCRVQVWEGMIFINLAAEGDKEAADFSIIAAKLHPYFKLYRLADTKIVARKTYPTHGNWKLAVENFRECYHCAPAHPEYTMVNAYVKVGDDTIGGYEPIVSAWADEWRAKGRAVDRLGWGDTDERQPHGAFRQPIREGYFTLSQDGQPVAPLLGDLDEYDRGETLVAFGPLFYVYLANDHATLFRFTPMTPTLTDVVVTWLVRADAVADRDYDVDKITWMWDVTTIQDTTIIGDNQLGVNSRRYVPGPYSTREQGPTGFVAWYLSRIG